MKHIFRYLKPHYLRMIAGFIIKFTGTIMDLFLPWILSYIIDEVVPKDSIGEVLWWGFVMFVCAVLAVLGNVIANRMASAVARDTTRTIRNDLFARIERLSCRQMNELTESSLISRMTNDTYNVHHIIGVMQRLGVRAPILLLGGIGMTLTLDPVLASVLIATLPFLGITVYFVSKTGIPLYGIHQGAVDKMTQKVRESITGIRVIKALSKTDYENDQFEKINAEVVGKETKAGITMAVTNPVMNFLLNMGWVMIIIVGAYRVNAGVTEPGKIIAFLTYFTIILNAMLSITRLFVMFSKAGASAKRITEVMEYCEDLQQIQELYTQADTKEDTKAEETNSQEKQARPHIAFEHVTFSYNKSFHNVEDVSFQLGYGQTLGIIGATGSGKTTLINLLMRFYDVDAGVIKIGGRDVRSYSNAELHRMFGVVFQNDMIFEDTVAENVKLGRELSQSEIETAAQYARIHDHIASMAEGYESYLAIKGANLSGGQKQRILVARALAAHPDILILDDASSALDYKTDALLRQEIKEHFQDTTTIIVAQRVSSVMNSDLILVIDEGRIIGAGTHQQLMDSCEEYQQIGKLQMRME